MPDLIKEAVIKRRLEIFLEFIDYFNLEGALGIAELLDEDDLTLVRMVWNIDDHFILDSVESYCNL
jgi:hypothetical protein